MRFINTTVSQYVRDVACQKQYSDVWKFVEVMEKILLVFSKHTVFLFSPYIMRLALAPTSCAFETSTVSQMLAIIKKHGCGSTSQPTYVHISMQ